VETFFNIPVGRIYGSNSLIGPPKGKNKKEKEIAMLAVSVPRRDNPMGEAPQTSLTWLLDLGFFATGPQLWSFQIRLRNGVTYSFAGGGRPLTTGVKPVI